jgi:hypothetical protein
MAGFLLIALICLAATGCSGLDHRHKHHHHHAHHLRSSKLPWPHKQNATESKAPEAVPAVSNVTDSHAVALGSAASASAAKAKFQAAMTKGKMSGGLQALADKCSCSFHDVCECDASLKFMQCISDACASSRCDCQAEQYHQSCLSIALTCPSLYFECTNDRAICRESTDETAIKDLPTDVLKGDLEHALEQRCTYMKAEQKGWLNADNRLKDIEPLIKKYQDTLTERGEEIPTHTCKGLEQKKAPAKKDPEGFPEPPAPHVNPKPWPNGHAEPGSNAVGSCKVSALTLAGLALAKLLSF